MRISQTGMTKTGTLANGENYSHSYDINPELRLLNSLLVNGRVEMLFVMPANITGRGQGSPH